MAGAARARRSRADRGERPSATAVENAVKADDAIVITRASDGFCGRCGEAAGPDHACTRDSRAGTELEPDRYCEVCGSRLTVQILPQGVESHCLRCTRRARRSVA